MTRAAVVSFWHPLRSIPASTKRGGPSALQGVACTISPSSWAIARPRGARWSAGFVPQCTRARFPPCWAPPLGRPQRPPPALTPAVPEPTVVAAARALSRAPGRRRRPRVAGGGLCLPLLARVHFEPLVSQAHAPGATMVPAPSALLRVLVLTRLDKARRRHINDFTCDAAGGLVAGLHGPPQTSSATAYASRTGRDHQQKFLSGWIGAVAPVWCPHAHPCSLDFPPLPFRGDATGLAQPSLPRRGKAGTSGRSFLAHEPTSPGVCAANAHLPRRAQADEALQCVALWPALTGGNPQWRSFASKAVP